MKRILSLMFIVMLLIPYANVTANPILDKATDFIKTSKDISSETRDISLALMAIVESEGKVGEDLSPYIDEYVDLLLNAQNPNGGWGYREGHESDVLSTAYAVIALSNALNHYEMGTSRFTTVRRATDSGVTFIKDSFNGEAWGYVEDTQSDFYPSVIATWALGSRSYSWESSYMLKNAVEYLEKIESYPGLTEKEIEALKLIAYYNIGYTPKDLSERIEKLREALLNDSLTQRERAMVTYVVTLYEGVSFDVAKALLILEDIKNDDPVYWANQPAFLMKSAEIVETSSYATLSFALVSDKLSETPENPFEESCKALKALQNDDGSWSYIYGLSSNEKATYYALKALKLCYFRDVSIDKGLNWTENRFEALSQIAKERGQIYPAHIYALLTLLEFNLLNETQKQEQITLIKSLKRSDGKWGAFLGPQPYDTALAIKALLALGVSSEDPDVQKAKEWLLSISSSGWGTFTKTKYYSYMLSKDVSTTLEVLEALYPISSREELQPHIEWLLDQRTEDGAWPIVKDSYIANVLMYQGKPSIELTIRATELLYKLGYNLRDEILKWVEDKEPETVVDTSLKTLYLSNFKFIPRTGLYDVIRLLGEEKFTISYIDDRNETASTVKDAVDKLFGANVSREKFKEFSDGNYIVLANYSTFKLADYNPYVSFEVGSTVVTIEGKSYPLDKTIVLIPGKYEKGVILFVLYKDDLSDAVKTLFDSGLIRYLNGKVLIVQFNDTNYDGKASVDELSAEIVR
ncbi:hypothetical protein PAP_00745 [Palaeococcus pacificus DY20341]|uniref:Squalene cyclase C-terminal domain-containing protein n=1 Tax=Palaeococcus pacificus DY20341 TaxID=1343739 RepID=A0A075LRM9_9EURY|nr:prenyltransferase/squalene oxidase repeat-containing protein [Palaeococcus pacificus]AIF68592.1 hypothetical protein PAP_00745 [Palaeococcus pacificus DY20341]